MPNHPTKFKQSDVTRALKGAVAAGLPVAGFTIDQNGKIIVRTTATDDDAGPNDWDAK